VTVVVVGRCRYFDKEGCGYLKAEDLAAILHATLGPSVSHRYVKDLVAATTVSSRSYRGARLHYRDTLERVRAEHPGQL
jgi:hypothetical protein